MEDKVLKPGVSIKPKVTQDDVKAKLSDVYGLKCVSIKQLNGYDDNNYHVRVESDFQNPHIETVAEHGYIFKVINRLDSEKPDVFHAQNQLLLQLMRKSTITCPKPIPNKNGEYLKVCKFPSGKHIVRLLEFITGSILHQVSCTNDLYYQVGKYVAELDKALMDFDHPAYHTYETIWMMGAVSRLSEFLYAVRTDNRKKIVEEVINGFTKRVSPVSKHFERGLVHGDFNEQNIVVTQNKGNWNIKAVLDFGDSHIDCYLFEIAITMTYMMLQGRNYEIGGHVLAGYLSVFQLPKDQISLLKLCTCARLCQSVVMGAYSSLQDPSNDYILSTAEPGWALLEQLWPQKEDEVIATWMETVANYGIHIH